MKRKFLEWKEYQDNIEPEERLTFGTEFPFLPITLPPETVFAAWHGTMLPTLVASRAQATLYVCRTDIKDPVPFNFDVYSFIPTRGKARLEVISQKLEYHWTEHIPTHIKEQMPEWVKNRIQKFLPS